MASDSERDTPPHETHPLQRCRWHPYRWCADSEIINTHESGFEWCTRCDAYYCKACCDKAFDRFVVVRALPSRRGSRIRECVHCTQVRERRFISAERLLNFLFLAFPNDIAFVSLHQPRYEAELTFRQKMPHQYSYWRLLEYVVERQANRVECDADQDALDWNREQLEACQTLKKTYDAAFAHPKLSDKTRNALRIWYAWLMEEYDIGPRPFEISVTENKAIRFTWPAEVRFGGTHTVHMTLTDDTVLLSVVREADATPIEHEEHSDDYTWRSTLQTLRSWFQRYGTSGPSRGE